MTSTFECSKKWGDYPTTATNRVNSSEWVFIVVILARVMGLYRCNGRELARQASLRIVTHHLFYLRPCQYNAANRHRMAPHHDRDDP